MLQINSFVRPDTLDEALSLLHGSKIAAVIGGGAYLRLGRKRISTAIDLGRLPLDQIEEQEADFLIGARCTFGDLERSQPLNQAYHNLLPEALKDVVGVQFRNCVTVGATVFSRYGFSDLLPALLALDAGVLLHRQGAMSLEAFLNLKTPGRDILTHIRIPKTCTAAACQAVRLSTGDYAVLNLAVAQMNGQWRVAVGARPGRAALAIETMALLNDGPWNPETFAAAATCIQREMTFGTNSRGSAAFRRQLAGTLLHKALQEVCHHAG